MRIEIATLFPQMCEAVLAESVVGRGIKNGCLSVSCRNIRDYTLDKHRKVDDSPFGGGRGMVMSAQPVWDCYRAVCDDMGCVPHTIYMSPKGRTLTQKRAAELSQLTDIFIICGHYEGIDQRVLDRIAPEEISIGDYVLTGGELPALVLVDTVARMCKGVLPQEECFTDESHWDGLLEYPHYTRPEIWDGMPVPPVLLSGHHGNIDKWRQEQKLETTRRMRPDLLENNGKYSCDD